MHRPYTIYKGARGAHSQICRLAGYSTRASRQSSPNDRHKEQLIAVPPSMVRITSVPSTRFADHVDVVAYFQESTFQ